MSVTTDKNREADTDDELEHAEEKVDDTAEEGTVDDTVDGTADDTSDVELRVRRWPRRVVLGALFVAALAASGFFGWQLWQQRQIERAGEDAQQAAVTYAQVLTSIDSNKVDENFAQVLDGATGEFKDMYSQSSVQLRQLLVDNKANAHGVVLDSAVQSASKDKVVVLLFVDQSVSNTSVPDPRVDRSRIKMTMENVDGRWRASKVELP
jgi:Mce-associated membrane protein